MISLSQDRGLLSHPDALHVAQQAPLVLKDAPKTISASPWASLFSAPDTADLWITYENLLLSCLRSGDDKSAIECLDRITARFGSQNERVMALTGLGKEATAKGDEQLQHILTEYQEILGENAANIPIAKRRVALLRSMGKDSEAITALGTLLDSSPTDAEGWSELADLHLSQGHYPQAIFALEEVLVLVPNAWNMHARLGEVFMMAAASSSDAQLKYRAEALKRFARSVELCDHYLRGYYGLKLVADQLQEDKIRSKPKNDPDSFTIPDQETLARLSEVAMERLADIVRRYKAGEPLWQGYDSSAIAAAADLLDKTKQTLVR
ncbi:uncharacterized protein F5Z01DRAFT_614923 [Emericellopsis atlantica]|uniref:ER membrane protein complex subunit 2 n=1 Tax=Emericellopsis atlantica TaxID=2614577 RepID=A0A9P7ZU16_9HYPO|nr:uncharacterized protein F5Z01DRAFT_614923 [Emericellopsis atlantica]KAG9258294.1 hypothetical protein F5Z01DRAFT_614923 [Emericellopsis atlantica]